MSDNVIAKKTISEIRPYKNNDDVGGGMSVPKTLRLNTQFLM